LLGDAVSVTRALLVAAVPWNLERWKALTVVLIYV
jgi:hypothetical protein